MILLACLGILLCLVYLYACSTPVLRVAEPYTTSREDAEAWASDLERGLIEDRLVTLGIVPCPWASLPTWQDWHDELHVAELDAWLATVGPGPYPGVACAAE